MIHVSPWTVVLACVCVIVAALVAGVAITRARRLDRLHQRILASRDALSRLLLRRASEAELLAHAASLESAGGPSLVDAARAYIQDGGDQLTTDGLDRRTSAQRQADRVEVSARLERASALTRAIREMLTPDVRARIEEDPQAKARLEALDATCYRIELTRNVHNVDVAGVRALRSARMVKLLRLAGHAPVPEPIDPLGRAGRRLSPEENQQRQRRHGERHVHACPRRCRARVADAEGTAFVSVARGHHRDGQYYRFRCARYLLAEPGVIGCRIPCSDEPSRRRASPYRRQLHPAHRPLGA